MKREGTGPVSEVADTARHRALSAVSRVRMLELVRRADDGLTAADVVAATGLHASTVRAHLDQLTESGLLTRHRSGDGSPGRPAWRYRAVPQAAGSAGSAGFSGSAGSSGSSGSGSAGFDGAEGADRPYRELAAALVGHLARDADDPHTAGVRAGRDWGRALAAPLNRSGTRTAPLDGLVKVLDRLGFSPRLAKGRGQAAAVVELRSCPFLDLAMSNLDVVCGVHQGVIGGALGALGASAADVELQPFAAPGACLVRVRTGQAASTRPRRGQSL